MPTKFVNIDWVFDADRWANDLRKQADADLVAAQELSGLTAGGWYNWLNPKRNRKFQHPGMLNFLNVCNLLHLDPRDYFSLNFPEVTNA